MRSIAFDTAAPLGSRSIAALRAAPLAVSSLPCVLQAVADEKRLRPRSERLALLLAAGLGSGQAADLVCDIWRGARAHDRDAQLCLMSLLEVRLSGLELLQRALRPVHLMHACSRAARSPSEARRPAWRQLLEEAQALGTRVGVPPVDLVARPWAARRILEARAGTLLQLLLEGRGREIEVAWLREAAGLEQRATALCLEELAGHVGTHDWRRISRLLPILSRHEERLRDTEAILVRWPDPADLGRREVFLVTQLEARGYEALCGDLGARAEGEEAGEALRLVRERVPLPPELWFAAGVVRAAAERLRRGGAPPLDQARAVLLALRARRGEALQVEFDPTELGATSGLWRALGVTPEATGRFEVAFDARRHQRLLARDGLPDLGAVPGTRPPDLREMVLANVHNEHILCGMLAIPRVGALPGLVETVVRRTRSIKVLLEIANRRDLYSGSGNRGVPRALLWHASSIPPSALRKFVHVRFTDRVELAALASRGSRARPEVRHLAADYLSTLSTS